MWASQVVLAVKNPPADAGDLRDGKFDPWVQGGSHNWTQLTNQAHGVCSVPQLCPTLCGPMEFSRQE